MIHSADDSAESIATPPDSDLEDEQLRKMLASPLYTEVSVKLDAESVPKLEANAQRAQAYHSRRESLMSSSSRDLEVSWQLDAVFSCHSESSQHTFSNRDRSNESGNRFESSVHAVSRVADPAKVGKSLLNGNKDHLLNQARSELMKQEHQVGSLNNCVDELQKQAHAQGLEFTDSLNLDENKFDYKKNLSMKEKALPDTQIRSMHEMGEMKRAQERVDEVSVHKLRESHVNDSGEFQEVESNHSGRLSYVPSQPATLPSYRSMLSRDKRLPLDTWNASGPQENVFGNHFSTFDSHQNHYQGIHHFSTPGVTGLVAGRLVARYEDRNMGTVPMPTFARRPSTMSSFISCGHSALHNYLYVGR